MGQLAHRFRELYADFIQRHGFAVRIGSHSVNDLSWRFLSLFRLDVPHDFVIQYLYHPRHRRMESAQLFRVSPQQEQRVDERAQLHSREFVRLAA